MMLGSARTARTVGFLEVGDLELVTSRENRGWVKSGITTRRNYNGKSMDCLLGISGSTGC